MIRFTRQSLLLGKIALRLFARDCSRGALRTLIISMVLAMTSVSVIYLVVDRIESASAREISDILGADLVVNSPQPITNDWVKFGEQLDLKMATAVEFASVLFANEKLQLSSIKAVTDYYPLRGSLFIAETPRGEAKAYNVRPKSGEIWIEPRLYNLLEIESGNEVELGYTNLQVGGVLTRKPGQGSTLFNLAPTVIMNIDDLPATQIIQPGSRVNYRYLFAGSSTSINALSQKIKDEINTSQSLSSVFDESPIAGGAMASSKKFIGLSSLLTLILLGVAIAMSANRYALKQFDMSALMRCFGMSDNQVLAIFIINLCLVALIGIMVGAVFGISIQHLLVNSLSELFTESLPEPNYQALFLPMLAAMILLFGFSLPALLQIKSVPPMRVLRRQLKPMLLNRWVIYSISLLTLVTVMWLQMGNLKLLFVVLLGLSAVVGIFSLIAAIMLKLMKLFANSNHAAVNFSLRQLDANKGMTLLHLLAFSITLFVIALIILVRSELIVKWQQSLGDNIPNHFMVNVRPAEIEPLTQYFKANQIEFSNIYPMIRGRIVGLNGEDVKTAVSAEGQKHNSLNRELNITWATDLPIGNELVNGDWGWHQRLFASSDKVSEAASQSSQSSAQISIEKRTADALNLTLGDTLDFTIGADPWSATIVNIREIDWQTFTPNFYIIADPGSLDEFESTYITSFHLASHQKNLLPAIIKRHPGVTLIELDIILAEIQSVIAKVSIAVEVIMSFVVIAGVALLWAAMDSTFDNKYKQSAILRTLGASQQFLARSFRFEYFWMAILSAVMAIVAVELVAFLLYQFVFEVGFSIHWHLWWLAPLLTIIVMMIASWRGVKRVTLSSPLSLIRGG